MWKAACRHSGPTTETLRAPSYRRSLDLQCSVEVSRVQKVAVSPECCTHQHPSCEYKRQDLVGSGFLGCDLEGSILVPAPPFSLSFLISTARAGPPPAPLLHSVRLGAAGPWTEPAKNREPKLTLLPRMMPREAITTGWADTALGGVLETQTATITFQ